MAPPTLTARLADDPELGAGNVLTKLREHGADPAGPGITFDVEVDGHPAWTPLTLGQLTDRVAARAAWLHGRGITARDPVAVYVTTSADVLLSFMALTWIGAIPCLMNGNMPGDIAVEFIRRLRPAGVLTDGPHRELLGSGELGAPILADPAELGSGDPAAAPRPFRYAPTDPIVVTHSSGTTRMPAAVVHSHRSLFEATRQLRLGGARAQDDERILSALPAAHTAGILTLQQALCRRSELVFLSGQGGSAADGPAEGDGGFSGSGDTVLAAIERWHPRSVYGFAVTWAELARYDLSTRDMDSVAVWFNTGDCAHEAHIRRLVAVGSHPAYVRGQGVVRQPGSRFIDGIGSTEMGYSGFRISHTLGSSHYGRCVGKPHIFAEVTLINPETGEEVPVGEVGHVAYRSPTVALGYWNDSVNTYRNWRNGYYLTGDLMYRDAEGYFYHVDRAIDAVDLGDGNWLYTAMTEERILLACPDVRDCTVVSGEVDGAVVTDILLLLTADADADEDRTAAVTAAMGEAAAATLRRVVATRDENIVTGPTGKVRKFLMRQRDLTGAGAS